MNFLTWELKQGRNPRNMILAGKASGLIHCDLRKLILDPPPKKKKPSCNEFGKVLRSNNYLWELQSQGTMTVWKGFFHAQLSYSGSWECNWVLGRLQESQNPLARSPSVGVLIVFNIRGLLWEQILNVIRAGKSLALAPTLFDRTTKQKTYTGENHTE